MARLWCSSTAIGQVPRLELPADAAVHSPHLPCPDKDRILASSAMLSTAPISAKVQILSPYNEEPYSLSNLHDVLLAIIPDVS